MKLSGLMRALCTLCFFILFSYTTMGTPSKYLTPKNSKKIVSIEKTEKPEKTNKEVIKKGKETNALGGSDRGGGDEFVADFLKVANQEIIPWIRTNGKDLNPPVEEKHFAETLAALRILSVEKTFESCHFKEVNSKLLAIKLSKKDREVSACFDGAGDIFLSRSHYPIAVINSSAKRALVAHEIFRKMGLEGDQYELTKQMYDMDSNTFFNDITRLQKKFREASAPEDDASIPYAVYRCTNFATTAYADKQIATQKIGFQKAKSENIFIDPAADGKIKSTSGYQFKKTKNQWVNKAVIREEPDKVDSDPSYIEYSVFRMTKNGEIILERAAFLDPLMYPPALSFSSFVVFAYTECIP